MTALLPAVATRPWGLAFALLALAALALVAGLVALAVSRGRGTPPRR